MKPVTAHPLFNTVVALWSGALLGLSTVAVDPMMFAAGLQRFAPIRLAIAQLPVTDFSDQAMLAATLAGLGFTVGWIAARVVQRRSKQARQTAAQPDNRPMPNTSSSGASSEEPPARRRRTVLDISALTLVETPRDEPLDLTAFVEERAVPAISPCAGPQPAPQEQAQRALRDSLAALRELRGAA